MKSSLKDWIKVLVLLLDEAAAVVIVFLILKFLEVTIPVPVAIIGALLLGVIAFVLHKAVIPTFHKKQITGTEGMLGMTGRVTEALVPEGTIHFGDESWRAEAMGEHIEAGEEVEITAIKGLKLTVKRKD